MGNSMDILFGYDWFPNKAVHLNNRACVHISNVSPFNGIVDKIIRSYVFETKKNRKW